MLFYVMNEALHFNFQLASAWVYGVMHKAEEIAIREKCLVTEPINFHLASSRGWGERQGKCSVCS